MKKLIVIVLVFVCFSGYSQSFFNLHFSKLVGSQFKGVALGPEYYKVGNGFAWGAYAGLLLFNDGSLDVNAGAKSGVVIYNDKFISTINVLGDFSFSGFNTGATVKFIFPFKKMTVDLATGYYNFFDRGYFIARYGIGFRL